MSLRIQINVLIWLAVSAVSLYAEPVIIAGNELPWLLGKPVADIRVTDLSGNAIPFQVDEVTPEGEYVLSAGERPNAGGGDGVLSRRDEVVFLWGDTSPFAVDTENPGKKAASTIGDGQGRIVSIIKKGAGPRAVIVCANASIPLSPKRYIEYNPSSHRISTPYYYAVFAKDRFHFTSAGVRDFSGGAAPAFINLTNELRVSIDLRTLFGLVPVRYTEDNIVCYVRRYKVGPVRLIRRGDFHLNLGLGVKGSKAAVNQICYPQIVEVPVYINLPVRFRTLFSQAFVEMTPVIREEGRRFRFVVPSEKISLAMNGGLSASGPLDMLHEAVPGGKVFMLRDGVVGYGWLLRTTMKSEYLGGSGFVMRRPPSTNRKGAAECGFRLAVRDVPKGSYYINNWVFFSGGNDGDIERLGESIRHPIKTEVL